MRVSKYGLLERSNPAAKHTWRQCAAWCTFMIVRTVTCIDRASGFYFQCVCDDLAFS